MIDAMNKHPFLTFIIAMSLLFGMGKIIMSSADDSETSTDTKNSSIYSNYHKCEYNGCDNYASGSKYCSIHNQNTCIKSGCYNKEAYQGAGYCRTHLYDEVNKKLK